MSLNLSSLPPQEQIATLFIAYFDRAPAPSGLNYWVGELTSGNMTIDQIASSFAVQLETIDLYPQLGSPNVTSPESNLALVTSIFNHLFGRDPANGADNYYVQQLNAGADVGFIVVQIANGAVGNDLALLENKIEVGLDWSTQALINDIATVTNPMTAVVDGELVILDEEAYASAQSVLDGVTADPATVDAAKALTQEFIDNYGVVTPPEPVDQTFILTEGTDVLTGGDGDDTFRGNQDTTDTSDVLDGAGGDDTLIVSVQTGAGDVFTAPTLSNIETVEVNGPNLDFGQSITIDLSNASGYEILRSFQTTTNDVFGGPIPFSTMSMYSPALVEFLDIQNANNTNIEIIDTNADHRYTYDTNAMTLFGGDDDTAEILLQEVDGSTITLEMETPVPGTPGGDFRSHIDRVEITSVVRPGQVSSTTNNFVWDLNVGPVFNELEVFGDADLEIEKFLDEAVNNVDASTLQAGVTLDLIGQGVEVPFNPPSQYGETPFDIAGDLTVLGGTGDNRIDVHGNTNGTFLFQDGDDVLRVGNSSDEDYVREDVFGDLMVGMGGGDDEAILNITGEQAVNLGDGDDDLIINGNVDDLSTRLFNDGRSVIEAGDGDDDIELNGQSVFGIPVEDLDNDYLVDLGDGDDSLTANGGGNLEVSGGAGEDDITVNGNGNQDIDSGEDDDTVAINGNGYHNIALGGGDDDLTIIGSRETDNNIDSTYDPFSSPTQQTVIDAGAGDDTVLVDGDHHLLVSLGLGADSIELNADELSVDDIIYGNAAGEEDTELDTLILNNDNGNVQDGSVGRSETSSLSGMDIFDLRDTNITLALSSDNFDTALDGHILVKTTEADSLAIPQFDPDFGPQLYQGMTRGEYEAFAEFWFGGNGISTNQAVDAANNWVLNTANAGVTSVNFFDADGSNDASVHTPGLPGGYSGDTFPFTGTDTVDFQGVVDGKMIVDITDIPMSVVSGRSFEFQGGNIRDVIIADDASISSRLVLDFDASRGTLHSVEDTLQVIDGAHISAADLRNTFGLEIIELLSAENQAQTWTIELNDRVINQTTSNAPLIIRVDPNVPAGSEVYIDLDPSIWSGTATKNVIIETVANAQIYIDSNDGNGPQLVTQPDYSDGMGGGTDYNPGPLGTITVMPRLVFTQNADNLEGTDFDDTFIFDSISKLSAADSANGFGGHDTLLADGVTVANQSVDLFTQLGEPGLTSIEEIEFDTGMNVLMTRLDGDDNKAKDPQPLADMLDTLRTGSGNDVLLEMEAIGNTLSEGYFLDGGDDFFSTANGSGGSKQKGSSGAYNSADYYADGGAGDDTAVAHDDQELTATDFETIILNQDADANLRTKIGVNGDTMTVIGDEGSNSNYVDLDTPIVKASDGTLATVLAFDVREIDDNSGSSIIIADNNEGGPDGDLRVNLNSGDDNLTVTNVDDLEVNATTGTKTVTVGGGVTPVVGANGIVSYTLGASNVNDFIYNGGTGGNSGVDNINALVDDDITINAGGGDDNIVAVSSFAGPGGTVTVNGQDGDDTIFASSFGGGSTVVVDGGDGADDITVDTVTGETSTVTGGRGIDNITLTNEFAGSGGQDTIVIGNIVYNSLQQVAGGTTQNFVQNGVDDPAHAANTAENGVDTVSFFNMEGGGPGAEDRINISAFITDDDNGGNLADDFQYGDWRGGATNVDAYDFDPGFLGLPFTDEYSEIAVIAVNDGFELNASHIVQSILTPGLFGSTNDAQSAAGIEVDDNGSRVVAAAYDTDGDGAFDTMDLYLVQDVDSDAGQAWAVDKIMTVSFATEIGAITSIDTDNFVFGQL